MVSWIEKIKQGINWRYQGGVHPATNKQDIDCSTPATLPLADELIIPVVQHIGQGGKLLVKPGDKVKKYQALSASQFYQAPPVHAPCAGEVVAIEPRISAHPSAIPELSVVLKVDHDAGEEELVLQRPLSLEEQTPEAICERAHQSGIAGMGGAGFPTALKLTPTHPLKVLIINGAECEPYISSDDCLMRNYADGIIRGTRLLAKALKPEIVIIAVEDDKPEALRVLRDSVDTSIQIRSIPTKYPSGGEKQLIQVLTGKQIPAGELPIHQGILVQNVGTAYAIQRAVEHGEPLSQRLVTLAGDLVAKPTNYWVAIGTQVKDLISGRLNSDLQQPPIMGGSMMGFMLGSTAAPIIKTSNCILVHHKQAPAAESPCIRCGECAVACPMGLLPQQLYWYSKGKEHDKAREYKIMDCIECGACAYVCPSQIPLVQYYRQEKAAIRSEDQAKLDAERAKQRFDARQERLEQEKLARKQKHKEAAQRRAASKPSEGEDPVQAALARVKQAQQQPKAKLDEAGQAVPDNAAAIAARKARKAAKAKQNEDNKVATNASSNPAVAAAIARAKAKKADSIGTETTSEDAEKPKASTNPAVAAAIARAKAKKAASQPDSEANSEAKASSNPAVAAAIARAKAKKQAAQDSNNAELNAAEELSSEADTAIANKSKAVRAAVARAKAKQQAAKQEASDGDSAEVKPKSTNPAVAAAIAQAKAKKAAANAQQATVEADETEQNITEQSDTAPSNAKKPASSAKSAAVAKAIAAAKAKKAKQLKQEQEDSNDDE